MSGGALEDLRHVLFACHAYEALTSSPDGPGLDELDALDELRSRFDPCVVGALIDVLHPARAPFPSAR